MKTPGRTNAGLLALGALMAVLVTGCESFALLDDPPRAAFTISPSPDDMRVGEPVTLDASPSTDPQGYALTYRWEFKAPSNSLAKLSSLTGKTVTFYPDLNVQYSVSLSVKARVQEGYSGSKLLEVKQADPSKARLTVTAGIKGAENGTVEPWGVRAYSSTETRNPIPIVATPSAGYRFQRWDVITGVAVIKDILNPETTITLPAGAVTEVQAQFVALVPATKFLAWDSVLSSLVRLGGTTGKPERIGGDGSMVGLTLSPAGTLYGLGSSLTPVGTYLFTILRTNGAVGTPMPIKYKDASMPLSSLAFSPTGILYGAEDSTASRLFKVNTTSTSAAILTLVGPTDLDLESITFASDGTLLGIDTSALYTIDSGTGEATRVAKFPSGTAALSSLSLSADGILYAVDKKASIIYRLDFSVQRGTVTVTEFLRLSNSKVLSLIAER